jgi:hypothetical protein
MKGAVLEQDKKAGWFMYDGLWIELAQGYI